jgi:serine/threonine-protein kinase 19
LVHSGLLQCRDVGSWWLGIPGAGVFMKHFTKGRQGTLRRIRKRKFKEILLRVTNLIALITSRGTFL